MMYQVSAPTLYGREREYVLDCLNRNQLSWNGEYVARFEHAFASFCDVRHAIACSNGTSALHLAMIAIGVEHGDCVFMPVLSYIATANAVRYCGGVPIFCEVNPHTWCLDPTDLVKNIQHVMNLGMKPKAIVPVHLYGVPAEMEHIQAIARAYDLKVIEDAAQAHGATYKNQRVGSIGDLGAFSFYGNKILTCGEGGMVTTNDDKFAEIVRLYRGQGTHPTERYRHVVVGYNYRLTNIQAAIGLAQLEQYPVYASTRKNIIAEYNLRLTPGFTVQRVTPDATSAHWMFTALLPPGKNRDRVMSLLTEHGIETRPVFPPLDQQASYSGLTPRTAADIAARGINLPTHGNLVTDDVHVICNVFKRVVDQV